ncbi:tyrosine-type recombinase/integrase [Paenibacillus sp. SI8]|uniref:tyrosine-type recombinase/integrase n=1 Tax=unclassified Paenibacillus TaxID=185978 RepID=UPI003467BB87
MSTNPDPRAKRKVKNTRTALLAAHDLDALFERFYSAKSSENLSAKTLQSYRDLYTYFCRFLEIRKIYRDVRNITPDVLRDYMSFMLREKVRYEECGIFAPTSAKTTGLSATTVNIRMKPIRTMFRFLKSEELIEYDPTENVKRAAEEDKQIDILNVEQIRILLQAPNQRTFAGFRDYVLMNVLLDTFGRISETLSIKKSQIDFNLGMIYFPALDTKGKRDNNVPVTANTLRLIKELLKENEDLDSEYLFLANYGEPLTDNNFRHRLNQHAKKSKLNIRIHPHLFRHTAATLFLENGGDIRHLVKILNHKDLRIVTRYTHLSKTSIKRQHEQYSPMNDIIGKLSRGRKIKR